MSHDDLGHVLWAGALDTSCFMASGSPSRAIGCRASFEMWSGSLVDIGSFGGPTWVCERGGHRGLWTRPCALLRCAAGGYMLWCSDEVVAPEMSVSRDEM